MGCVRYAILHIEREERFSMGRTFATLKGSVLSASSSFLAFTKNGHPIPVTGLQCDSSKCEVLLDLNRPSSNAVTSGSLKGKD